MAKESKSIVEGVGAPEFKVKEKTDIESCRYVSFKSYPGRLYLYGITSETFEFAQNFTEEKVTEILTPLELKGIQEGLTVCICCDIWNMVDRFDSGGWAH